MWCDIKGLRLLKINCLRHLFGIRNLTIFHCLTLTRRCAILVFEFYFIFFLFNLIMVTPEKMGAEATKQPHTTTKSSEGKAKSKSDSSKTTDNEKLTKERIALVGNEAGVEKIVHMDASGESQE